jgi:AraC-like DNA-binding protein
LRLRSWFLRYSFATISLDLRNWRGFSCGKAGINRFAAPVSASRNRSAPDRVKLGRLALDSLVASWCDNAMRVTYKPTARLSSYVEELWYCDGHGVIHRKERALPTGRFQLFISLSDAPIGGWGRVNWEVGRGAPSVVVGMRTRFTVIDTSTLESAMGVVFWPGAARAFFDAPADAFYNESVPLDLIWGSLAGELRDRVREASTPAEKFQAAETGLLESVDRQRVNRRLELHPAVRYALGEFVREPHIRSVLEVARETGLSRHRFAELFREQVGLTPKLYCRLHRFQGVLRQIASGAPVDWADLALAGGYCDQAHLANEFRSFSGISPGSYLASERSL